MIYRIDLLLAKVDAKLFDQKSIKLISSFPQQINTCSKSAIEILGKSVKLKGSKKKSLRTLNLTLNLTQP